jgi:prepilin-type N-terminal cleavage/methylation domain-containing protein
MPPLNRLKAFTLIELLIVVGIIAILAAIAVPNFLEAQIRAKVSRTRTDIRTVATALESYRVDNNTLPPQSPNDRIPINLTTPIAYISGVPRDVFELNYPQQQLEWLSYNNVAANVAASLQNWPPNDLRRYGSWRLFSVGPFRQDGIPLRRPWTPYDPTNGTVSAGNILRTEVSPEGRIPFRFWDPANPND